MQPCGVVLLTELYPPDRGGSAALFGNIYPRLDDGPLTIIRDSGGLPPSTADGTDGRVVTVAMGAPHWGVTSRAAVRRYGRMVAAVASACRGRRAVVHCGRALPEGLAAWGAARMGGRAPFVCWTHGEELEYAAASRELAVLQRHVHRRAAALVANSRNTARQLDALGVPPRKIHVVHPGVDAERFGAASGSHQVRSRYAAGGELLLVTVGRLQRRKGHDLVLQALAQGRAALPPVKYLIVGDGDERARLETMAAELGLGDLVSFAGGVPFDDLPDYYGAADLFVHPNRIDGRDVEGFGLVFLEAAAAGVPAIGGATGGVPEAVEQGVTGILVSGTDPLELLESLRLLAGSPELRRRMGEAGRARVRREFTWARAVRQVAEIQREVCAAHWAGSRDEAVQHA